MRRYIVTGQYIQPEVDYHKLLLNVNSLKKHFATTKFYIKTVFWFVSAVIVGKMSSYVFVDRYFYE